MKYNIPIRLGSDLVKMLQDCKLVSELYNDELNMKTFQPALDINVITLQLVFDRIDSYGAENFALAHTTELENTWQMLKKVRMQVDSATHSVLVKDL